MLEDVATRALATIANEGTEHLSSETMLCFKHIILNTLFNINMPAKHQRFPTSIINLSIYDLVKAV